MRDILKTVLDCLMVYAMGHIANFIIGGEFSQPSTQQFIFYLAVLAVLRSNREGGAA